MKNSIITIFKKEMKRFFGDSRSVFSTIILPGLMIFVMYSFMGNALQKQFGVDDNRTITCYTVNMPDSLEKYFEAANFKTKDVSDEEAFAKVKKQIKNQKTDICVVFPKDFEAKTAAYDTMKSKEKAPDIEIYYNSSENNSSDAYESMTALLNTYESSMCNKFDINSNKDTKYDLASDEDAMAAMFASMLPMLLLVFLFSGALAVAPESIAGEKERGTIATLLITPIKRQDIAIGKILALSLIAVLSGFSSALGTMLSMPKMLGAESENLNANVYGIKEYLMLAVIIVSTVLLLVTVVSLISTFAKTIKEAQTYATPLLILVLLIGITAMFGGDAKSDTQFYCIPIYNSVQCMVSIFKFHINVAHILITVGVNLLLSVAGVIGIAKMFQSERIVFSKN